MTYKTATVRNRVTLSRAIALFITRFSMVGIDYYSISIGNHIDHWKILFGAIMFQNVPKEESRTFFINIFKWTPSVFKWLERKQTAHEWTNFFF